METENYDPRMSAGINKFLISILFEQKRLNFFYLLIFMEFYFFTLSFHTRRTIFRDIVENEDGGWLRSEAKETKKKNVYLLLLLYHTETFASGEVVTSLRWKK